MMKNENFKDRKKAVQIVSKDPPLFPLYKKIRRYRTKVSNGALFNAIHRHKTELVIMTTEL